MTDQTHKGRITEVIEIVLAREVTWYEGKMELELIPRIREMLNAEGIRVDEACISQRIANMNIRRKQEPQVFLRVSFPDCSTYSISIANARQLVMEALVNQGDIDVTEAMKLALNLDHVSLLQALKEVPWKSIAEKAEHEDKGHPAFHPNCWPEKVETRWISLNQLNQLREVVSLGHQLEQIKVAEALSGPQMGMGY
jgi:hypothetical protein